MPQVPQVFDVVDSWFAGASAYRRIEYRVMFDSTIDDYRLEYRTNGSDWDKVGLSEEHRVAKGIAAIVIREDMREVQGKNVRRLA